MTRKLLASFGGHCVIRPVLQLNQLDYRFINIGRGSLRRVAVPQELQLNAPRPV